MPFKEETVSGVGYSFKANNRRRVAKTKKDPTGIRYMTDEEFEAHKAGQKANMEKSIQETQRQQQRQTRIQFYKDQLKVRDLTQQELNKLVRLERGMQEAPTP